MNSEEPKVTTKIKNKKGKKVTEVKVKFNKKEKTEDKSLDIKMKHNSKGNIKKEDIQIKANAKSTQRKASVKLDNAETSHFSQHVAATTQRVLRMVEHAVKTHQAAEHSDMVERKHNLEMMKVKEAVDKAQKVADLEHDLHKDYPENGTVEIVNWEGTFAPIHGEPYVAPLHHQVIRQDKKKCLFSC